MNAPHIISRKDAGARGSATFFTGQPCRAGHIERRYVSNGSCVACCKQKAVAFNNAQRGKTNAPAQMGGWRFHPDDTEAICVLIDYLNEQRGLAPTPRPKNLPPVPAPPDPRTQWERDYTMHRERFPHSVAVRLATGLNPETHSPGWSHPRWADDAVAIGVPAARAALLEELRAPSYGGGAMPDYLK